MGILDGIVDWLATQVMNLLDLASTSVLGALDCNMDTFKRYFPAASAMYEIFIWTAIGLVLLNLVWQLYRCYGAGFDIDTENPTNLVVRSVIFLLLIHWASAFRVRPAQCCPKRCWLFVVLKSAKPLWGWALQKLLLPLLIRKLPPAIPLQAGFPAW